MIVHLLQGLVVPGFVVKMALRMIRNSVSKSAGFNLRDLCPIAHADRTFIPALFVAGRQDDFIRPHHSQQIHDAYAGDKNLVLVEGDHNSPRPNFLYDSVYIFLQNCLQVPMEWGLDRGDVPMGFPPWVGRGVLGGGRFAGGHIGLLGDLGEWPGDDGDLDDMHQSGVQGDSDMGVTSARQAQLQAVLFQMLAQASGLHISGWRADEHYCTSHC